MTPSYKMSSTVLRIRSTGVTIRFIKTATIGNTAKSRIMLPIHQMIMLALSFAHGSLSRGAAKKPPEEPFQRRHPRLHGDTETLHRNSFALCGRLATRRRPNIIRDALGETLHQHARDIFNHAPTKLSSSTGKVKILSHLHARPTSRRRHRRRHLHRGLALALFLRPGRIHHDPLRGLVTLDDLGGPRELELHRPHLGRHAPLVSVTLDVGKLRPRQ